jgi:hypothetical protein
VRHEVERLPTLLEALRDSLGAEVQFVDRNVVHEAGSLNSTNAP